MKIASQGWCRCYSSRQMVESRSNRFSYKRWIAVHLLCNQIKLLFLCPWTKSHQTILKSLHLAVMRSNMVASQQLQLCISLRW
jgi:hypothetical protein